MFKAEYFTRLISALLAIMLTSAMASADDANWPQWRGPLGDGHSVESGLPTKWDESAIVWKSPLKGRGQSSPVTWGEHIFLTTALEDGKQRVVFCVDSRDGKIVWERVAWTGEPEKSHAMNGWASATCATDGKVVVAFFGKGGLHAYLTDGQPLWSRDLGTFEGPWSTAACPVIVGDLVIQNGDSDRDAFIAAFNKKTGEVVWRKPRPNHRGWSTPFMWQHDGRQELVLNGHEGATAFDPTSGEKLWFTENSNGRGEPTVTPGGNLLFVVCGLAGDMYALKPESASLQPKVAWSAARRSGRDLPSPIVVGDYLLVTSLNGIATCYETQTGKELWKERLEGQFSSSPVVVNGQVVHQNEAGETYVIELGPTLKIVSRNTLGSAPNEIFRASLTPIGGRIYSRSDKYLYCIGKT